ncbi:MAG: hypothetical protein GX458_18700 [Phyllobacteriaceae bacterium]|nr:hypothetical protein [Phyllobacteriaceae bacterium]
MSGTRLFGLDGDLLRRRGAIAVVAAATAATALLLAVGCLAWAGQIALSHHYPPEIAALIVAAIAVVVAILAVIGCASVVARTRREVGRAVAASAVATVAPAAVSLAVRHTRLAGVVAAAGIGFWLARRAR